jgi:hypothetical protein
MRGEEDANVESLSIQTKKKPAIGLKPKWLFLEERIWDITEAINRHAQSGQSVPDEWLCELEMRLSERAEIEDEKSNCKEAEEDNIIEK